MENQKPPHKSEEISFRPITDGLGFHPFSDGLPYAPVSKGLKPNPTFSGSSSPALKGGTGAVVAGPPQVVPPRYRPNLPSTPHHISVPIAKPSAESSSISRGGVAKEISFGGGYLMRRISAYVLDTLFHLSFAGLILGALVWKEDLSADIFLNSSVAILVGFYILIVNWTLQAIQEVQFGSSLGKRVFGLNLGGSRSQRLLRALFFIPSVGFLCLGLIQALFDRQKRCWHDRWVDLQPMERS